MSPCSVKPTAVVAVVSLLFTSFRAPVMARPSCASGGNLPFARTETEALASVRVGYLDYKSYCRNPERQAGVWRELPRNQIPVERIRQWHARLSEAERAELSAELSERAQQVLAAVLQGARQHADIAKELGIGALRSRAHLVHAVSVIEGFLWRRDHPDKLNVRALSDAERRSLRAIVFGQDVKEIGGAAKQHVISIRLKSGLPKMHRQDSSVERIREMAGRLILLPPEEPANQGRRRRLDQKEPEAATSRTVGLDPAMLQQVLDLRAEELEELEPRGREMVEMIRAEPSITPHGIAERFGMTPELGRLALRRVLLAVQGIYWRRTHGEALNWDLLNDRHLETARLAALGYTMADFGRKRMADLEETRMRSGLPKRALAEEGQTHLVPRIRQLVHATGLLLPADRPTKQLLGAIQAVVENLEAPLAKEVFGYLAAGLSPARITEELGFSDRHVVSGQIGFLTALLRTDRRVKRHDRSYLISAPMAAFLIGFYRPEYARSLLQGA